MLMGFTLHFYIIFETNLLTGGPARSAVFFAYFSVSKQRNIKRSPNGMKPSGAIFLDKRNPGDLEWRSSNERGDHEGARRAPYRWARPYPRGPLERPPTYFFLLYITTYPENIQEHHENLIPPPQPSVSVRSHLGAFADAPLEGESTTEGLYIISKAFPISCE